MEGLNLNTVCEEARCPNIYECWGEPGTATFMILGDTCTRRCGFCAVHTGSARGRTSTRTNRRGWRKPRPPWACATWSSRRSTVTIFRTAAPGTSPTRSARSASGSRGAAVEVLTPDFRGVDDALDIVLAERPEVFSHNMETVPRLYRQARPGSSYERSLALLEESAARRDSGGYAGRVKTGLMVGLGETTAELEATIRDIRSAGTGILTIGQYLQPTRDHLPVDRYVHPDEFARLRGFALGLGFRHCEAGPLVRSSYHAHEHVARS